MRRLFLLLVIASFFSTNVLAADKVVVIPLKGKLQPGTVVEGDINNPILRLINNHTSGTLGSAMSATGSSPTAPAIHANHTGTGHALYGSSNSGYPTVGGINNGSGHGVEGRSSTGHGVYGHTSSTDASGVIGLQTGYSAGDLGSYWKPGGFFGGRNGVVGVTKAYTGYGVLGWDKSPTGGWAGFFLSANGNGVYISAPNVALNVASGTKNAVVTTEDGARLMYTEESTKVWFTDYGFGVLENGAADIVFEPIFTQTVNLEKPYHVFIQPYGNANLYVTDRSIEGFKVHSSNGGDNVEFSYRVVALRLGHEEKRIERAPWADNDPNLYPEKAGATGSVQQSAQN